MSLSKFATTFRQKISSFFFDLHLSRKSALLMIAGLILLFFALLAFFHTPNRRFEKLCDQIFTEELCSDGLSLHYTLSNPEAYGIDTYTVTLTPYDKTQSIGDYYSLLATLEELKAISPDALSRSNQYTYQILVDYMESEKIAYEYLYYDEPLSPTSGMQNQLPVLLAEYSLRDKNDIKNYLALLQSVPAYFDGLVAFEKEKAAEGLFMSAKACHDTVAQCNHIITEEELANGTHFLQTSFAERLTPLVEKGEITQGEMDAYLQANNQILLHNLLPAYQSLAGHLTSLCGTGTNDMGLCYYPEGRDYYQILVARQTGSSKSPEELMNLLKTSFMSDYDSFINVANQIPHDNGAAIFSLSEPDKMLAD